LLFDLGNNHKQKQVYELVVEDFLPERMALSLSTSKRPLTPKDTARIEVEGRYLYGAPAAGNRLSGQAFLRPLREAVPALPGYQFGSVNERLEQNIDLDEQALNSQGKAVLSIPSDWETARSPLSLTVQASLQESGGRPITRRVIQPIWPAKRLPGLRALFDGNEIDEDSLAEFELVMADASGNKHEANGLKVRWFQERRDYFWSFSDSEGWNHRYTEKAIPLDESLVEIAKDSSARISFPVDWGSYRVEVEDPQSGAISSVRFWAGYRVQNNSIDGAARPDQVKLALDKPTYQAGDMAKITVTAPAAGRGWLLLESSDGPLWWQEVEVPKDGKTFELPISADWARHDLYLSAVILRPSERKAVAVPKRAVGVLHLPLSRDEHKLSLKLQAAEKMRPRQPLVVKVSATDAKGAAASGARVLLSAVDIGILNITDYKTPDPFASLFGRKGYGVDQFDIYGQLIEVGKTRLANLAFGGDAALTSSGKRPDSSVNIVALQSAPVTLDEKGEAEISLDIPDFNGELRLMAQIWSEHSFGMSEAKTVIAAPLIVELSAPRFLASGDKSLLALDVHNQTEQAQQLEVKTAFSGQLMAAAEQSSWPLQLAAGEKQVLHLPIKAKQGYGEGQVEITASGLKLPDEHFDTWQRQWRIGVRSPFPAQTKTFRAILEAGDSWRLPDGALSNLAQAGLQARLELSATAPLNLSEHIRALHAYPYGCAEQTTSGLFPSLYANAAALKKLGIEGDSNSQRTEKIEIGIERLLGMQRYNGGFGLWNRDGEEEYWLTPYILDFLLRAREQGFAVPQKNLDKASERLLRYLQERSLIEVVYSDDVTHDAFATQAYAGYVLSRSKQAPLGVLRSLFERRANAQSGLPLLHLAIALKNMGDEPRSQQVLLQSLSKERSSRLHWSSDYGSQLRDQAQILALLDEYDLVPQKQREERLFALSDLLARQSYLSTQERGALFMVGMRLLNWSSGDWQAKLQTTGQSFALSNAARALVFSGEALSGDLQIENTSERTLYQRLDISAYPLSSPPAQAENLVIEREYLDAQGNPLNLSQLKSGDLVLVHIRLAAKERVPDALVVDLLPAGLELENQNLASSAAKLSATSDQVKDWQKKMRNARIKHQEYRDDRYVAALDLEGRTLTHLLYLARAVTPGTYQVPPPQVESMYRPNWQSLGETLGKLSIRAQ